MRVLMACLYFPTGPGQSYMTTELAQALVAAGHEVEVLLIDWEAAPGEADADFVWNGIRVMRCAPRSLKGFGGLARKASKFLWAARQARRLARDRLDLRRFDIFIAWSPALAVAPLVGLARRAGIPRRLLFIWDFFPDHHRQIGSMPGGPAYWIARAWEQRLMDGFTGFLCTLPQNADYLRRRFRVRADQTVQVTPIWSDLAPVPKADRGAVRRRYWLPEDRPIAVFGGRMVEGRGFDQMLGAAEIGRRTGSPILFLFVGDGRRAAWLKDRAQDNVAWRPGMARDAYLELLGACDVGMVATVPGVTSFSFPSKTLDYLRAGLPVVAAVEQGSDFPALLQHYGIGRSVAFGDDKGFLDAVEALAAGPDVRVAAQECLEEVFDVRHTVKAVVQGG